MGTVTKTKFQVFNGEDYDTKYFETSADQVKMEDGTNLQNILLKVYPVGSIYLSTANVNPGTLFGGTWVAWGAGRVPVGVNSGDTSFNSVEKTGGSKTVNLAHSHTVNSHNHSTANHTLTTNEIPSHNHSLGRGYVEWPTGGTGSSWDGWNPSGKYPAVAQVTSTAAAGGGGAHNHGNTGNSSPGTNSQLSSTQSVLPPYITCYMWKRTA